MTRPTISLATIRQAQSSRFAALVGLATLLAVGCGDDDRIGDDGAATETSTGSDATTATPPGTESDETTHADDDTDTTGETADALDRIFTYMGGQEALLGLEGFELELAGSRFVAGQGYGVDDPVLPANTFVSTVSSDLAGERLRVATQRTLQFLFAGLEQSVTEKIVGNLGTIEGIESVFGVPAGDMLSDRWAAVRRQHYLLNPHLPLRVAASEGTATVVGTEVVDGVTFDVIEIEDSVAPVRILADSATGEPRLLRTIENDQLHRDVEIVVTWDSWASTGAIPFPTHVTLSRGGHLLLDETREGVAIDPTFEDAAFAFVDDADPVHVPEDAERGLRSHQFHISGAAIGIPLDGVQSFVMPTDVADGVHHLGGGTHHSMVVEQDEGLVLVEAPLYPERSRAILEWAAEAYPAKPITHVVVSHFHEDHAAGVREVVAHGATLVVSEHAESFWQGIVAAPSTIVPDALARNPIAIAIEVVPDGGSLLLPDPLRPVTAYAVPNTHAEDLVMTVVDDAGALFIADIYSPGFPLFGPGASELYDAIVGHGLSDDITAIVGAHGFEVHSLEQLEDALP
jgi:glyoxylase-like metal-dependent hydrolase (beta-lactamase superfamily II)